MEPVDNTNSQKNPSKTNFCDVPECNEIMNYLPFRCKYCGGTFCKKHRLPENHNCEFNVHTSLKSNSETASTSASSQKIGRQNTESPRSMYGSQTEIPNSNAENYDASQPYEDELDREMENYIRRQEKQQKKKERERKWSRSQKVSGVRVEHRQPLITQATKPIATYWLMGLNTAAYLLFQLVKLLFGAANVTPFFYLSLATLREGYFLAIILTNFTPDNIISFIFVLIMLYGTGRRLEMRYGTKFLLLLYMTGAVLGTLTVILVQTIAIVSGRFAVLLYPTSTQWCGMMAIFSFIIYLAGLDREMRFIIYFIPVQMKGRTMLYFLMGINLLSAVGGTLLLILFPTGGFGINIASSLGQFVAIFAGQYYFEKYGHQSPLRFF